MSSREHGGRPALASGLRRAARSEAFAMVSCAVAMVLGGGWMDGGFDAWSGEMAAWGRGLDARYCHEAKLYVVCCVARSNEGGEI